MAKAAVKRAGTAAAQSIARDLLPFIDERFTLIQDQLRSLEGQMSALREDVVDRYERQLNLINEINHKMVRLEGKMEGYMEAMRLLIEPVKPKRRVG